MAYRRPGVCTNIYPDSRPRYDLASLAAPRQDVGTKELTGVPLDHVTAEAVYGLHVNLHHRYASHQKKADFEESDPHTLSTFHSTSR